VSNITSIDKHQKNIKTLSWILGIIAGVLIFISFITPWLFTQKQFSILDFRDTGAIGDTIGGIMNPFIGLAGIIITFLAFYLQYKANQIQIVNFNTQLAQDKTQFQKQLKEQEKKYLKNQIESQFFEMIRLHKENVNEMSLTINRHLFFDTKEVTVFGRGVFRHFLNEINVIFTILKKNCQNQEKNYLIHLAFHYFFQGLKRPLLNFPPQKKCFIKSFEDFKDINISIEGYVDGRKSIGKITGNPLLILEHQILIGHSNFLGHYFRHLFHSVKFIVTQPEIVLTYEEKRKYLRLLRAQLSNEEQALLFYNWKSIYGKKWEDGQNKFLTDYRMIHNLPSDLINSSFALYEEFDLNEGYRKEKGKTDDFLFEFQKQEEVI
jgi:hypothetical protein